MAAMDSFAVVDTPDRERWDRFVSEHPGGSIFHTPAMVDVFRGARNHRPAVLAALDGSGDILALLVAVRIQTLPGPLGLVSSRSIFYAEPLCRDDPRGVAALTSLLGRHDAAMRRRALFAEVRPLRGAGPERLALERAGYRHEEYLNYLIHLRQPVEELWRRVQNRTREQIRQSERLGVRVEEASTREGMAAVYELLRASYAHARVPMADGSLFARAFEILQPGGLLKTLVAYHQESPVAAAVSLLYKRTAYLWYAGTSRPEGINPMACLYWRQIDWGREHGYELFDLGGAGWPDRPYGVRGFKAKFGGDLVNFGRYRKIYSPVKLALAEKVYELARRVLSPRSGPDSRPAPPR